MPSSLRCVGRDDLGAPFCRALPVGEFLSTWKRNQKMPGRLKMDTSCPFRHPPRTPLRGYPCRAEHFRRTKSEWRPRYSIRATGPWVCKISIGAVSILRLPVPNQRSILFSAVGAGALTRPPHNGLICSRGRLCTGPPAFPLRPPLAALQVNYPRRKQGRAGSWGSFLPGQKGTHPSNTILTVK